MKDLVRIENFQDELVPVTDSLKVANELEKEHKTVMRDIRELIEKLKSEEETKEIAQYNFVPCTYINSNNRRMPMYLMAKEGFENLMFTYNGTKMVIAKAKFIRKFHEMEEGLKNNQSLKLPKNYKEALQQLIQKEEEKEQLQLENKQKEEVIKLQIPKVMFADAVNASKTSILVGELAKILKQKWNKYRTKKIFRMVEK